MVAVEVIVVAAFAFAAWRLWQSRQVPSIPPPFATAPSEEAGGGGPLPTPPPAARGSNRGAPPRLRTDPAFVGEQMREINRQQAALSRTEWSVLSSVVAAVRAYLDGVVRPAVEGAERQASSRPPPKARSA